MAEVDSKVSCKDCRYFKNADIMGRCHRFPEAVNKTLNDWCGEWKSTAAPFGALPGNHLRFPG